MDHKIALILLVVLSGVPATACANEDIGEPTSAPTTGESTSASVPGEPVVDPHDGGDYDPQIDPANFVAKIDNPYLPLAVGTVWELEGTSAEGTERVVVEVTDETREVMGVSTRVVRDRVYVDGELVEDTFDWFAQDAAGNVWYFGEEVSDYEDGQVVSTAGSWEAGVDGALPGIVMPATPEVGDAYRQEFYEGEAEDMFEILEVDATRSVPAGDYTEVLVTEDWNPLDPEVVEQKSYAPGVGLVFEETSMGGVGHVELVSFEVR
jgi:hypothetical protein